MTAKSAGRWVASVAALVLLGSLALWLREADLASPPRFLPRCAFNEFTGLYCPGCGNTRAAHALLNGDVAGALRQNAFSVLALPFVVYFAWRAWLGWLDPKRLRPLPFAIRQWQIVTVVSLFLLFSVLRNLPFAPFDWLAPDPVLREEKG